jgi:integrating conjugative element protein (TIGR03765 family)
MTTKTKKCTLFILGLIFVLVWLSADTTAQGNEPVQGRIQTPRRMEGTWSEASMLPVRSAKLVPGAPVVKRMPGMRPFFLVGDEGTSRAWLQTQREALRKLGAVGLVVNVETLEGLNALRRIVPGVMLAPVSGDDLAIRLKLATYPVLILPPER